MADSAQDTFKPLDDPNFDYLYFQKRTNEWENTKGALEIHNYDILLRNTFFSSIYLFCANLFKDF